MLEYKNKFSIQNPFRKKSLSEAQFFKWRNTNMYRTSYNDMRDKSPPANKNTVVPGYAGYLPGVKPNNIFSKTYAKVSRKSLNRENVEKGPSVFASTGFNAKIIPRQDETLHCVHHKYGKTTIMDTHPAIKGDIYNTTTAKTYRHPRNRHHPNWRSRVKHEDFDPSSRRSTSPCTRASGYVMNSTLFDGTGWVPDKNLHSDMIRTEYRNRFNPRKTFHKSEVPVTTGRMTRRKLVYDKEE